MGVLIRIIGLVAWVVAVFAIILQSSTAAWVGAAVLTVLAGALIDRWWAVLAPVALGLFWLIAGALSNDDSGEADPVVYGAMALIVCLGFALLLALGVGIGKLARRSPRPRQPGLSRT